MARARHAHTASNAAHAASVADTKGHVLITSGNGSRTSSSCRAAPPAQLAQHSATTSAPTIRRDAITAWLSFARDPPRLSPLSRALVVAMCNTTP